MRDVTEATDSDGFDERDARQACIRLFPEDPADIACCRRLKSAASSGLAERGSYRSTLHPRAKGRTEDMKDNWKLTESELSKLDDVLGRVRGGDIQNVEMLDGFLAALVCCPEFILPSEYLAVLLNSETDDSDYLFESKEEYKRFYELVNRQWHHISHQLHSENAYVPLVLKDEDGKYQANDWALGFLFGTELRKEPWCDLAKDVEEGLAMLPIFALAYEHDEDLEIRPFNGPIDDKNREDLFIGAAVGVMNIFKFFSKQRELDARSAEAVVRSGTKPGRNAPCPCGSGRKFKQCCGRRSMVH